jgi:putative tryptophan/tyrosine transport system substrate-binding protein
MGHLLRCTAFWRNPALPGTQFFFPDLKAAARTLGLQLVILYARTDSDLETASATFSQQHVGAVLVCDSTLYTRRTEQLAALAARHALPAIYQSREFALAGGLMSYGSSGGYFMHQAGIYAARILKGEKPAGLPVQQVTRIDLVINLKTAKALGLTIPETLLAADPRLAPVLNIVSTAALHHLFWPRVRIGSISAAKHDARRRQDLLR